MKERKLYFFLVLFILLGLLLSACAGASPQPTVEPAADADAEEVHMDEQEVQEDEHMEGDDHGEDEHMDEAEHMEGDDHGEDEHMDGAHGVPEEAAEVANPVVADDTSLAAGADIYATNCALCHGENGEGDGPAAVGLDKPPADLHESHVQELTDGALFYIITHGRPDTPMPAWEEVLTEEQRWQAVIFLRTFQK